MLLLAALLGTVAIVLSFACTSRQKDPIQRNAFVDIYSIVCVSGLLPDSVVWHVARHLQQHVLEFHGWAISRIFDVRCFRSPMLIHIVALEFAPDYLEGLKDRLLFQGAQKLFDSRIKSLEHLDAS